MKALKLILIALLLVAAARAQVIVGNYGIQYVSVAPSGPCPPNAPLTIVNPAGTPYTCQNGTWGTTGGGGGGGGFLATVPAWLQYLGDGSEGAFTCTTGTCNLSQGEHWYSSFNVSAGAIVAAQNPALPGTPFIIRSTGTCTLAGTVANSLNLGANGITTAGNFGSGGAGGGGGTAAGTGGQGVFSAGTAGTAGGGTGGNGTATPATLQKLMIANPANWQGGAQCGGGAGGAGGSSGGAGGRGGGCVIFDCQTINFTGTIDVSGVNGTAAPNNNTGGGGGGSGGVVILRSPAMTNTGTFVLTGGTGGSCGAFTGCGVGGSGAAGWSKVFTQ